MKRIALYTLVLALIGFGIVLFAGNPREAGEMLADLSSVALIAPVLAFAFWLHWDWAKKQREGVFGTKNASKASDTSAKRRGDQ